MHAGGQVGPIFGLIWLPLALLAAASPRAWAQPAVQGQQLSPAVQCLGIAGDLERLACFDRVHGRAPADSQLPRPPAAAPAPALESLLPPGAGPQARAVLDVRRSLGTSLADRCEQSRPFRESNYEPEIMAVFRTRYSLLGWNGRLAGIGLNHQSNGKSEALSRSWNRLIVQVGLERDNWMVMIRPWWRIPESARTDDNPDIGDYAGRADLLLVRKSEGHELSLLARHSLRAGSRSRGSLQIDYAFPITSYLKAYAQLFSRYGVSLIDYNHRQTRFGIGISRIQWL